MLINCVIQRRRTSLRVILATSHHLSPSCRRCVQHILPPTVKHLPGLSDTGHIARAVDWRGGTGCQLPADRIESKSVTHATVGRRPGRCARPGDVPSSVDRPRRRRPSLARRSLASTTDDETMRMRGSAAAVDRIVGERADTC